jgi:DHA1 family multidrug resistance protein-like MFS transporter
MSGGWFADFLLPVERGIAVAIFAATTLVGPGIGAISSQIIVQTAGWRWTAWVTMILGTIFGLAGYFILPETYLPVVEKNYARRQRWKSKNWALHSKLDERPISVRDFLTRYLMRPLAMLSLDPILFLMTLYISFTFGLVYLLFVVSCPTLHLHAVPCSHHKAYPISFVQQRGFSAIGGTLPLLSVCIGIILGGVFISGYTLTTFKKLARNGNSLVPEDRLPPMIVGAAALPIGLFWFSWSSSPAVSPWPQIIAGVPIGVGVQVILLQSLTYLIDIYSTNAASAISSTMIVRSLIGGTFPLFAFRLYGALGVRTLSPSFATIATNH